MMQLHTAAAVGAEGDGVTEEELGDTVLTAGVFLLL